MNINFIPSSTLVYDSIDMPKPAKNFIPNWFKNIPAFHPDGIHGTAKKCIPFLDSFTHGYIQELWCDVRITKFDNMVEYNWAGSIRPITTRQEVENTPPQIEKFGEFYDAEFQWEAPWEPKLPKGYSCLFVHPLNRFDLPFYSLSGIIDSDRYHVPGPIPFFLKKDFEGIIPAGTPIYQIIPIKRENWTSIKEKYSESAVNHDLQSIKKFFYDGYKKTKWIKKEFK